MKVPVMACAAVILAGLVTGYATAADIARLEWGAFTVDNDSSDGWSELKSASSDDGRSITLSFAALEAKADGGIAEAASRVSGHYNIAQPGYDSFASYHVVIEGHVIKSRAAVARLVIRVGTAERTIDWAAGQEVSEKFSRSLDIAVEGDGRLPSPFAVGIEAYAKKGGEKTDAAYVSVSTVTITAQHAKIAERQISMQVQSDRLPGLGVPAGGLEPH
jgi:hypothetical protein